MNRVTKRRTAPAKAVPRAERAGASSELQALLDATVDAIVIIDHRGHVEVFNRSAERLFGYAADEVVGRNVRVLMTGKDRDSHDGYMSRYLETGVAHIIGIGRDVCARRKDGTTFPVFLSVGRIAGPDPPRFVGFLHDTTVREEALRGVQRERDRANQYLEVAQTVLVALDGGRRISLVNRKGCEVLGRREEELVGCDWLETAVAPEDRATARAQLEQLRERSEGPHYCEYHVRTGAGRRRLIAWRCIAVEDSRTGFGGLLCSGEDITEQRGIEQAMERTRALLQEAQSIAGIGNFELYEPEAESDYWSPEAYRIFGLDPARSSLSRDRSVAFVHPGDRKRFDELWQSALESEGTYELAFRIVRASGEVRFVHSRYQVTNLGDGRRRIAGTLHDITERQRIEEGARQSQERLTHVSRLATLGEMAAGIAHELNQPLAAIATYAQASRRLLANESGNTEVHGALEQISAQALRAGEVIRRLRSLVRNRETQREATDPNELVRELTTLTETDARLHDARVAFELAPVLPRVAVDRIQIQQVLLNLLRNAVEALEGNPRDRREIRVQTRRAPGNRVELRVCDNGPGVEPRILDHMFDPFCTTKTTGTGLGLAISRTIVEAHDGRLEYQAHVPRGACFSISLPACPGHPQ